VRLLFYNNTTSMTDALRPTRLDRVYSRAEIEDLIANGRSVFIVEGSVIKADAWLRFHPRGPKAIMHLVGRDATDEVNA